MSQVCNPQQHGMSYLPCLSSVSARERPSFPFSFCWHSPIRFLASIIFQGCLVCSTHIDQFTLHDMVDDSAFVRIVWWPACFLVWVLATSCLKCFHMHRDLSWGGDSGFGAMLIWVQTWFFFPVSSKALNLWAHLTKIPFVNHKMGTMIKQ